MFLLVINAWVGLIWRENWVQLLTLMKNLLIMILKWLLLSFWVSSSYSCLWRSSRYICSVWCFGALLTIAYKYQISFIVLWWCEFILCSINLFLKNNKRFRLLIFGHGFPLGLGSMVAEYGGIRYILGQDRGQHVLLQLRTIIRKIHIRCVVWYLRWFMYLR